MSMHRREFLTAAATSPAFLGFDWGPFGPNEDDTNDLEYDDEGIPKFPDHITETRDDIAELENYQPRLVTQNQEARTDMQGMYGWTAESEDYDVTAHYFWVRSNTQRSMLSYIGLDWGPDEHHLDHEPIIVFEAPDGTVDKVVCSGGHHIALEIDGEWGRLIEDRVADRRTHVVLRQMRPHNHFMEASSLEDGGYVQGYSDFGSWLDRYRTWFRNGRYSSTADVGVMDPFSFHSSTEGRTHWWRKGTKDAWVAKHIKLRSLSSRDTLRYEED